MPINTVEELREFLSAQMEAVRAGSSTPAAANAGANLAGKMLSSVKMELEYNKMAGATPDIKFLNKSDKKEIKSIEGTGSIS